MRKVIIPLFLILFSYFNTYSQKNALKKELDEYFEEIRTKKYSRVPGKELYNKENAELLLGLFKSYYNDTLPYIRQKAYYLTYKTCYKSNKKEIRQKAVFNLVLALKDSDSGNIGNYTNWLSVFQISDYSRASKDSLRNILLKQNLYQDKLIKLTAFILQDEVKSVLQQRLAEGYYKSAKAIWAVHLALARLGIESEIDFCINTVKEAGINDDVIYELVPDLIYTRQKKAFDYLFEILNSNTKNCFSANPENAQKIVCGYRIMEYLAPVIDNFPLKSDSYGDLLIDDYEEALPKVREWVKNNANQYSIIKDTY